MNHLGTWFLKQRGTARITPTAKILDRLYAEEHSVGDRMVAFGVNPNLAGVPRLKTFAGFVNMNVCELEDDYCGCVGAYCTRENAHA